MRFRTRTQEVEAIQWTGDNLEEVQAFAGVPAVQFMDGELEFHFMDECGVYYILVPMGSWLVQRASDDWAGLSQTDIEVAYEPVPDLIRTVEDYEGLPAESILVVVDKGYSNLKKDELRYAHECHPTYAILGIVCSVVRLGGEQ